MSDEDRLNRIEKKLDDITEILSTQAAHDERITALATRVQKLEQENGTLKEQHNAMDKQILRNSIIGNIAQWMTTVVVAAAVSFFFKRYF